MTSARSATLTGTLVTWTGFGSRFPSFEICQNGSVVLGDCESVRKNW